MMKKNKGRTIYADGKGNNYSVDTQHGRLEKLNDRGRHQGEFDFDLDLNQTKPADKSGGHDLNVK